GKYIGYDNAYWDVNNTQMGDAEKIVAGMEEEEKQQLAKSFEREFKAFCITIGPTLHEVFTMENHPMKLKQLTYQKSFSEEEYNIRIIRNDNKKLDLIAKEDDINFMINSLKKIKG